MRGACLPLGDGGQGTRASTFDDVHKACVLQALEPEFPALWPLPRDLVRHIILTCKIRVTPQGGLPFYRDVKSGVVCRAGDSW